MEKEDGMEFRITVGLGQDTVDPTTLEDRAAALQRCVPSGAAVLVDVVKAAIQLVLPLHADDALEVARQAVHITEQGINDAGLNRPTSIVVVEAEAVASPVSEEDLRPHQPK